MKKAVSLRVGGIKCDNKDCDYEDMTVRVEEYDDWLDKPCPKCGENLLTKEDLKVVHMFEKVAGILNEILPEVENDTDETYLPFELDGSGKLKLKNEQSEQGGN